ncbi:D-alanyl-D-alanine carboxypeptidase/D-alanyl-D-alanine-endopeptidase [Rhodococcus sp. OK302]|uniref:D-alanyl-D-alanine carboxypeptidase/D-alanyl-D-alanine-endopeptidase n=1 Tax=Rhodococcus sp. OK302 TaxID=1882769 RepID=UPI000B945F5C|nr:D-alanyl-D-alanine carboxypeptidase [Rhodococcus sp. OK302]OYD69957.1 D-alanyl-D-alanine carboxypeptidase/D-alanyl-D-alanine-endopeptidase (penicillin-binding protein 4) [Rhodococcus sp. OK302]
MPYTTSVRAVAALVSVAALLTACSANQASNSDVASAPTQQIPPEATRIMTTDPYAMAQWSYLVVDPVTDEVIYSNNAETSMFLASQTKHFTVGTTYDTLGVDHTVTTPVYATAEPVEGTLTGDLVLVGSGDLALGGRNAAQGRFDFATDGIDHVYADALPGAVLAPGDPLAGLNDLARQVAAAGITRVNGDVLVDPRLWDTYSTVEGLVPSIFVNDNLVDIQARPGAVGEPATIDMLPGNGLFRIDAQVTTGKEGSDSTLSAAADPSDPTLINVTGSVPAGKTSLTVFRITDAPTWARQLFVEALRRNGIEVAPTSRTNNAAALPADRTYSGSRQVASLQSAPLSESGGMILATSYNTGANTFLCLLAVAAGSPSCSDGLPTVRALTEKAGIAASDLVVMDGQGSDPSQATPTAVVDWLDWVDQQPWAHTFWAGQPVLGERGSLSGVGTDSPAKGKVIGKTGTSAAVEPDTGRLIVNLQALSGYMINTDGRRLLFVVAVSDAVFPDLPRGVFQVGGDVGDVAAAFQQAPTS